MERLLSHQQLPSAVGWSARQRLGALAADLTDLGVTGVSVTGVSLPEAAGLPALAGPGSVWGTLYVAEGATLGGRVLRRHIEARLGPVPARFLDGHGDRTQPMWRDLGQLADRYVHGQQDTQLAQQAAIQAFAAFSTWASNAVSAKLAEQLVTPDVPWLALSWSALRILPGWEINVAGHPLTLAAAAPPRPPAARSWLPLGSEVVEGLGDLGDGVGDGLVPVHVRPAGAQFPHAFITQGCRAIMLGGRGSRWLRRRPR